MIQEINKSDADLFHQARRPWGEDSSAEYRAKMRRFMDKFASLPADFQATCPKCGKLTPAKFDRIASQIVLTHDCPACGKIQEVHYDAIWTELKSDRPCSPEKTFSGDRIHPNIRRLPRTIESLCPECSAIILARYFVQDGQVFIEKTCPEHGYFRDKISADALLFSKAAWWSYQEHPGQKFPHAQSAGSCPADCGLCGQHLSSPCLAQIDLTNRCNMRCPICFANAGVAGYVYEPTYEEIVRQLKVLRDLRPTPCTAIQFSGGEPTIHPDFLKIVSTARDMGFSHIQIATNGIRLGDLEFAKKAHEAGLHTLYLQFDGVGDQAYQATRNYPGIWDKKLACIENCRKLGMKICLVPTLVKGINDNQVGEIFKFAVANIDTISAISYQPVSFTGRISCEELSAMRYTLGDLAHDIAKASGAVPLRDMFPLSVVVPLSQLLQAITGNTKIRPSCHTDCAFGTYFLVSPEGKAYPFPQVINIEGMFTDMNRLALRIEKRGRPVWLDKLRVWRIFSKHFRRDQAPPGLSVLRFMRSLYGMLNKKHGRGKSEKRNYKTLLCAGMHFQDRYNFDVERAKRCVILYSTPNGVFPFCTHNCGPEYRHLTEGAYAKKSAGSENRQNANTDNKETSEVKA